MKINKNGWSLATEIMFIIIFMICLLISIFYLNKMGLLGNDAVDNFNKAKTDVKTILTEGKDTTYQDIEDTLLFGAKRYVKRNYDDLGVDILIITSSKLIDANYLDKEELSDPDKLGNYCSGYVEVEEVNNKYIYSPYISCLKYTTKGYIKRRDI